MESWNWRAKQSEGTEVSLNGYRRQDLTPGFRELPLGLYVWA